MGNTVVWNIGGTNEGPIGTDPQLDANFAGTQLLGLIVSMGSGLAGRMSWIDNVTLAYDGSNGGTAFDYTFDFGDVEPAAIVPPAPEPGSLALLGLGTLLLALSRRRDSVR